MPGKVASEPFPDSGTRKRRYVLSRAHFAMREARWYHGREALSSFGMKERFFTRALNPRKRERSADLVRRIPDRLKKPSRRRRLNLAVMVFLHI